MLMEEPMRVIYERCCGIDLHKKMIVACVLIRTAQGVQKVIQTFSTMLQHLYRLRDWLKAKQCEAVAMESTGVFTPPPMLPIVRAFLWRGRRPGRADAEDDTDLLLIHLDPFDQGANDFSTSGEISLL
jgi:hypothetical protein